MQDHYPERSEAIFVVNAPAWFLAVWAVVKVFINENTQKKVKILGPGRKTTEGLMERVERGQILERYGGGLKGGVGGEEERRMRKWQREHLQ